MLPILPFVVKGLLSLGTLTVASEIVDGYAIAQHSEQMRLQELRKINLKIFEWEKRLKIINYLDALQDVFAIEIEGRIKTIKELSNTNEIISDFLKNNKINITVTQKRKIKKDIMLNANTIDRHFEDIKIILAQTKIIKGRINLLLKTDVSYSIDCEAIISGLELSGAGNVKVPAIDKKKHQ